MSYSSFQANIWLDQPAFSSESGFRRYDERSTFLNLEQQPQAYLARVTGISCGRRSLESTPDFSIFPNLHFLELDDNNLKEIPGLAKLVKLEVLKINKNFLTDLSDVEKLTKLIRLDVDFNELAKLPELGHLKYLRSIHALPNPLQFTSSLPAKTQMDQRAIEWYERLVQKMETLPIYNGEPIQYSTRTTSDKRNNRNNFQQNKDGNKRNFGGQQHFNRPPVASSSQNQDALVEELRNEIYQLQQEIVQLKRNK
ncbi:hypothetical protein SS50377_23767 [Spironucleus salmonicida]|uniref:Leucine-rich repeat-containing protein n=1 Tax=Spironucleus salmonicida TaxID=348837 RepID=V6LRX8_9EUKA|nr:hypothetical protein SS50377_23767 [Spironucleus salmonicida]|eukprot:EST46446.1 hypothetical protein SS50377_13530 [Spironucleus salmonicida]